MTHVLRWGVSLLQLLVVLAGCDGDSTEVRVREGAGAEGEEAAEGEGPPPEVAAPYDEEANAAQDIDRALAAVRGTDKRVLLVFGANWCNWCRRLEHVLRNHTEVGAALGEGFEVVHVNTGARGSGANAEVDERYGNPTQHGLPVLVVLDASGEMVLTQETSSLEIGDRHDPAKILAFLGRARR